jgi:hypothetical protein
MKRKVFFKWIQWVLKRIRHSNEIFMQLILPTKWNYWEKEQAKITPCHAKWKEFVKLFLGKTNEQKTIIAGHYMIFENKFINKMLDISQLKTFGWITYVHVPNENKTKLD